MQINKYTIRKALRESIDNFIESEIKITEATAGCGGALTGAFLDGSGQADTSMGINYPIFNIPISQGNNLGKMVNKKDDELDVEPALKRHDGKNGSISVPKKNKKKK